MLKLSYSELVKEIHDKAGVSEEEINSRVNKKLELLKDLISKEGAAHIVANELGVKLVQVSSEKKLKISDVMPGLNFINLDAKIISIYEVRSFKTEKREGKVANIFIGDETGTSRLVLWDTKLIELVEKSKLKEGDIISIKNAYSKENNGNKELHLGNKGEIIINPEKISIENIMTQRQSNQKPINMLKENEFAEIMGTVVQLFEPKSYFACPTCNKKAEFVNGVYLCNEHGNISAKEIPIVNFFLDDGTDNIRVVCFRDAAEKMLDNKFESVKNNPGEFDSLKNDVLGKQIRISGKVNKNMMFDRLEFTAHKIQDIDPKQLIEELKRTN